MKKQSFKKFAFAAVAAMGVITLAAGASGVKTEVKADMPDNILYEDDWRLARNLGQISFGSRTASFTPKDVQGATYSEMMGDGNISFSYQISYPQDLLDSGDAPFKAENAGEYPAFFGVTFLNSPDGVTKASSTLAVPYDEIGGFPYMVAFDFEPQTKKEDNEAQFSQLGLTLRRYKYNGGHDFTKWSTVNPTNDTYFNNAGNAYESKIPTFYKPVTVDTAFDGNKHDVSIDVKSLYKSLGDEYDAIKIDVKFDGELCLTVIDEMPFVSDYLSLDYPLDKRGTEGFVSVYCYNGDKEFENYTLKIDYFGIEYVDNPNPNPNPNPPPKPDKSDSGNSGSSSSVGKKGCSSEVTPESALLCAVTVLGAAVILKKKIAD